MDRLDGFHDDYHQSILMIVLINCVQHEISSVFSMPTKCRWFELRKLCNNRRRSSMLMAEVVVVAATSNGLFIPFMNAVNSIDSASFRSCCSLYQITPKNIFNVLFIRRIYCVYAITEWQNIASRKKKFAIFSAFFLSFHIFCSIETLSSTAPVLQLELLNAFQAPTSTD